MKIQLSASKINKTAPYKVSLDSHNEIIFTTDNACRMRVGFTDDCRRNTYDEWFIQIYVVCNYFVLYL